MFLDINHGMLLSYIESKIILIFCYFVECSILIQCFLGKCYVYGHNAMVILCLMLVLDIVVRHFIYLFTFFDSSTMYIIFQDM